MEFASRVMWKLMNFINVTPVVLYKIVFFFIVVLVHGDWHFTTKFLFVSFLTLLSVWKSLNNPTSYKQITVTYVNKTLIISSQRLAPTSRRWAASHKAFLMQVRPSTPPLERQIFIYVR
jgi:hypothetical protein